MIPFPSMTTREAASCWTNHLSQIANPPDITAYQYLYAGVRLRWLGDFVQDLNERRLAVESDILILRGHSNHLLNCIWIYRRGILLGAN